MPRLVLPVLLWTLLAGCSTALTLEVDGTVVVMRGELNSDSPAQVEALIKDNPEIETIVMADVPGSLDDVAALEAARLVREAGLNTEVPADGERSPTGERSACTAGRTASPRALSSRGMTLNTGSISTSTARWASMKSFTGSRSELRVLATSTG